MGLQKANSGKDCLLGFQQCWLIRLEVLIMMNIKTVCGLLRCSNEWSDRWLPVFWSSMFYLFLVIDTQLRGSVKFEVLLSVTMKGIIFWCGPSHPTCLQVVVSESSRLACKGADRLAQLRVAVP
jgi:hypothetical protein